MIELPKRKSTRRATQSKGKDKEERSHEQERQFDIIQIQSDDSDNEARILANLLILREIQIDALRADLHRSRNFNHFFQVQNKQMSVHMAVYETRAIQYKKEASKTHVRLEELMGEFEESEGEYQPRRKSPRTMGLKKALEKQKEEEDALLQSTPLTALFEQKIEKNWEAWLERVNNHLEKKLEKANRDLTLQRRMTGHYKKLN